MKRLVFILLVGILMVGCRAHVEYTIEIKTEVNDSLKENQKEYLLQLVESASKHNGQSAGKARHLDDVIYAAKNISNSFYETKTEVLVRRVYNNAGDTYAIGTEFNYEDLDEDYSKNEPQVYIWYKIKETGKPYKIKLPRK